MSEISKVIESEIADFFAGFGGPGEPDIQNGEAQRLLTERVLSVLALRERAEPVSVESYPDDSDLSFAIDLNEDSEDFQTAQWLKELRRRRAAPPAPVHVDEIAAQAGIDPAIADAYMQGCHDTEARLAAAPPEPVVPMQPLVIDTKGTLRFKENPIVRKLLDYSTDHGYGLNEMALEKFDAEDRMQLAQLIGYSLSGYGSLSYVSDESYARAAMLAAPGNN